jgi:hypothetical protein
VSALGDSAVEALVTGAVVALAAVAATRVRAAYHDGLRSRLRAIEASDRERPELGRFAFSISGGFLLSYALPYALASGVVIIYLSLLAGDMIGIRIRRALGACLAGLACGVVLYAVVTGFHELITRTPELEAAVHDLWRPLLYVFPLLAPIAAAKTFGWTTGVSTGVAVVLVWQGLEWAAGLASPTAAAIALLATTAALLIAALRERAEPIFDPVTLAEPIGRIRRSWPFLVPAAAALSAAAAFGVAAGDPLQAGLLGDGHAWPAFAIAIVSLIGFVPLIAMTGVTSGVWSPNGYPDWFLGAGYLIGNPVAAAFAGAALAGVELLALNRVVRLLSSRPVFHTLATGIRDAVEIVAKYSLLVGATLASARLAGPTGAMVVIGAYVLNDLTPRRLAPLAVPVFAFLAVALVVTATS